jgi:hypothetical protein
VRYFVPGKTGQWEVVAWRGGPGPLTFVKGVLDALLRAGKILGFLDVEGGLNVDISDRALLASGLRAYRRPGERRGNREDLILQGKYQNILSRMLRV